MRRAEERKSQALAFHAHVEFSCMLGGGTPGPGLGCSSFIDSPMSVESPARLSRGILSRLGPMPVGKPPATSQFDDLQEEEIEREHDNSME